MSATIPDIATSRLILRPLNLLDVPAIQQLFPRWDIVQYMSSNVPWPYPADGAMTFVRDIAIPAMLGGKEWHWSIRPKVGHEQLIGVISLMDQPDDNRGFWLDREWQGRGLMSEASTAVTDYWFETLERPILRAPKAVANVPSRRISERSGMRIIKTEDRDYVSGRLAAEIWEITREEWRRRSAR
ncbi:GNAT family N-acetyltransferase [Bradyrhizobium sediminis]|uniref:GNAT family N-acetyltransferase n=1 Tax=Bradyrhizobium sediminis TaxID=2840469 RepID=A0A975NJT7_9BRAD|nr:GNAT family N-acetyltransferase [Bradyrhizobium sediminis]QWG16473.1 GNAT family N-acetyltransferase [Bradyrhizobium sediminis]